MINLESEFSPRVNPADANYPFGSIKDNTSPGANDGTPLAAVWGNNLEGFQQAVMSRGGITPSGLPDTAQDSQLLEALDKRYLEIDYQTWTFVTGGLLTDCSQAVKHTDGNYYSWGGNLPHTVAPGTDPALPGSGYVPRTDVVLRNELLAGPLRYNSYVDGARFALRDVVSVADFQLDGVTDAEAIQAAFDYIQDGMSVYFPKKAGGYNTTGTELLLSKNDVTLFSDPRSEYSTRIKATHPGLILRCTGYGLRLQSLLFEGSGGPTSFGVTSGVEVDRSSLGDAETYSNLDIEVRDCGFFNLRNCFKAVGRNVFLFDSMFSTSKSAIIGEAHKYNGGATFSEFRGWRIAGNRFHSIGAAHASGVEIPTSLDNSETWCVKFPTDCPTQSHIEITGNNEDFTTGGFFSGNMAGVTISGNIRHRTYSIFVYSKVTDAATLSAAAVLQCCIEDTAGSNQQLTNPSNQTAIFHSKIIWINGARNLSLGGKYANSLYESCVLENCQRVSIPDIGIRNSNGAHVTDTTKRPALSLYGCSKVSFGIVRIENQLGTVNNVGISFDAACSEIALSPTIVVSGAYTPYSAANLSSFVAPATSITGWTVPAMLNGYTYLASQSTGWRLMTDGTVEIDVTVQAGADNVAAFQLPVGARPIGRAVSFTGITAFADTASAYALITTAGDVIINWNGVAPAFSTIRGKFSIN